MNVLDRTFFERHEWLQWVFSGVGVALLAGVWKLVKFLAPRVAKNSGPAREQDRGAEFPYDIVSPEDLAQRINQRSDFEIPYFSRSLARDLSLEMRTARHLLLVGRTGIGKTREAYEHIRRLESITGEKTTVLIPKGSLEIPDVSPIDSLKGSVVLFVDSLPSRYRPGLLNDEQRNPQGDLRQQFKQVVEYFEDILGPHFRVVATSQGAPDLRERLRLDDDPFWKQFGVITLPELPVERRGEFLNTLEKHFGVTVSPTAKATLISRSDGTFSSLITFLRRHRKGQVLTESDVSDFSGQYPQDWRESVYRKAIHPHLHRRALFQALSVVKAANMEPVTEFVVDLAARMSSDELLFWHRHKVRSALRSMSDWIDASDDRIRCVAPLSEANVSDWVLKIIESVEWFLGHRDYRLLRPSIHELVKVLIDSHDTKSAKLVLSKIIAVNRDNAHFWIRSSQIAMIENELHTAESCCQEALKYSHSWHVWNTLAVVLQARGHFKESIQPLQNSATKNKWNPATWILLGRAFQETGQHRDAINALRKAERLDYANARVHNTLALVYEKLGKTQFAIQELKFAAAVDPNSPIALRTLAVLYDRLKKRDEAVKAAEKAAALAPDDTDTLNILGRIYADVGRASDAIRLFEQAMQLRPGDWSLAISYGMLLARTLSVGDLIKKLSTGFTHISAPASTQTHPSENSLARLMDTLAMLLRKEGQHEKAAALAAAAIEAGKNAAQFHVGLGMTLRKAGDLDRAEKEFREAIEIEPEAAFAWSHLSRILREQALKLDPVAGSAKLSEALTAARRSVALGPRFVRARTGLALALLQQQQQLEAEKEVLEALKFARKRKELAELHAIHAAILEKLGRNTEAREALARARGFDADSGSKYYEIAAGKKAAGAT